MQRTFSSYTFLSRGDVLHVECDERMMLAESIEEEKEGYFLWTGRQPLAVGKSLITGCSGAVSIGGGDFVAGTVEVSCGVAGAADANCGN